MKVTRWYIVFLWIVAAGCVAAVFLAMVQRTVGLHGVVRVDGAANQPGLYVSDLKPDSIVEDAEKIGGVWERSIAATPVFADLRPIAMMDALSATLRYHTDGTVRGLRFGALALRSTNEYVTAAAFRLLGELGWSKFFVGGDSGEYAVYADHKLNASDVAQLVRNENGLRALGVSVPIVPVLPGYAAQSAMRTYHVNLRGHHRFLVYAENEVLQITFMAQDMNREYGADSVVVTVSDAVSGARVAQVSQADDGNASADQKATGLIRVPVVTERLVRGVYQVDVVTTDDVFLRDLVTTLQKVVLRERANLGDVVGYSPENPATQLQVYGTEVVLRAEHARGIQKVDVGGGVSVNLTAPFVAQRVELVRLPATVVSPKNEVSVVTDGVISFAPVLFFVPIIPLVSQDATAEEVRGNGIHAIVTDADTVPLEDYGSLTVRAPFSRLATTKDGAFRLVIAPVSNAVWGHFLVQGMGIEMTREQTSLRETLRMLPDFFRRTHQEPIDPLFSSTTYGTID